MPLRDYQQKLRNDIDAAWASGARNVMAVAPTGSGKTVVLSDTIKSEPGASIAIAHRQELVTQMATTLGANGLRHRIIGPDSVIRNAVAIQMKRLGRSFYDPNAPVAVAGIDTLVRREKQLSAYLPTVRLAVVDEGHHVLADNKWGRGLSMLKNARGLFPTATPERADGAGLGRHADGLADSLVLGPTQYELIKRGFLTPYQIWAPPSDLDLSAVKVGATGDYTRPGLAKAAAKSHIIGDVVQHYLRLAPGRKGVTFATDVETAEKIAEQFNAAGVPAAAVHAGSGDVERNNCIAKLEAGELLQLVNVDIFGEGFDLPAIEVVSMARPTASFALFVQQAGRALRPAEGKDYAIIIDHVGNIARHAAVVDRGGELMIDLCHRSWSLDRRERRSRSTGEAATRTCPECTGVYSRAAVACPHCGHAVEPSGRSRPQEVDGDLTMLDPAALAQLRGEVERVDMDVAEYGNELARQNVPHVGVKRNMRIHAERQNAQTALRETIAWWAAYHRDRGRTDQESYRYFFHAFGVDVLSAQTLKADDALRLAEKISKRIIEEY